MQSLDLCVLAARTKINIKYLEAIEADDRQSLPSSFFYRSFVDQYARSLSLDTQQIDAELDRVLSADAPLPLPGYESVVSRNVSPMKAAGFHSWRTYGSMAALVLVLAGGAGIYTLWRDWRPALSARATITRTIITRAMTKRSAPPAAPVTRYVQAAAPERAASEPARPSDKVTVDLRALEATWVSVSSDGKPVFSGILQPNQNKTVGGKESAKMRIGNAAGIEVRLNGKLLAPLGARGQVLTVLFTPGNFQIFSPPKESD